MHHGKLKSNQQPQKASSIAKRIKLDKDATHYRMDYPRRGVAAIFDQLSNGCSRNDERRGAERDIITLCKTFSKLEFEVEVFRDLSLSEVELALEELSQRNHTDCDCFILVYISPGIESKLKAKDRYFDVNRLWCCFTAEVAPSLANKPKIFIIQTHRSRDFDKQCFVRLAIGAHEESEDFECSRLRSYYIPERADFLIVLSNVPGFVPWRRPRFGSWYIQILCEHLDRHGFDRDIMTILTEVDHHIAMEYASRDSQGLSSSCKKHMPIIVFLLIRIIQFTKKSSKEFNNAYRTESDLLNNLSSSEDDENIRHRSRNIILSNRKLLKS